MRKNEIKKSKGKEKRSLLEKIFEKKQEDGTGEVLFQTTAECCQTSWIQRLCFQNRVAEQVFGSGELLSITFIYCLLTQFVPKNTEC